MKHRMIVIIMAAAFALPAMAQISSSSAFTPTEAPAAAFRSTSSMTTSGSTYSSAPMFNADGTATYAAASYESEGAPSGPRKAGPPTPSGDPTPLGDAALPLLLMAIGYMLVLSARRRVKLLNR